MSSTTNYLVTGANRGLGKGLVSAYLARPNSIVIAAVRDVSSASAKALNDLPKGASSKLIIVKIDSLDEGSPATAIKSLQVDYAIAHLNVVIANAGILNDYSTVATVPLAAVKEHTAVNSYGPLLLFQATLPLLEKSEKPKFISIGSPMSSIGGIESRPFAMAAYSASKLFLHWFTKKIAQEHPGLISVVLDPGFVQTDMGNAGAKRVGMEEASTTIADSVDFLVTTIDGATKETSGHFRTIEGGDFLW
ncbi:NAD(P)-binding Rossmann-fold containing protein [Glarea lozoyensis ATCC 20868]|uniref:NAD(P)-binding Rossmann-fold containing protein n=2 Tax=Glarea lozoyensis TaxID=101852 RepID=S3CPX5_GLAL2|nr:NAD(P)-binding Rossmann-fold containing protein [Glarea lozoyensis ATCC 20868]EHK98435.1 putative Aflatoxin biosynthesis ketoreductase nor-1 [Glarea lozoyensis 74030]EPE28537.1 NAD(P)-binding Rossmann-fold containing protein [Glarea lozoyensis ATCC 20868]